jgi:hypothetical protein
MKGVIDKVTSRKLAVTAAAGGAAVTVAYIVGQTVVDTWGE